MTKGTQTFSLGITRRVHRRTEKVRRGTRSDWVVQIWLVFQPMTLIYGIKELILGVENIELDKEAPSCV